MWTNIDRTWRRTVEAQRHLTTFGGPAQAVCERRRTLCERVWQYSLGIFAGLRGRGGSPRRRRPNIPGTGRTSIASASRRLRKKECLEWSSGNVLIRAAESA